MTGIPQSPVGTWRTGTEVPQRAGFSPLSSARGRRLPQSSPVLLLGGLNRSILAVLPSVSHLNQDGRRRTFSVHGQGLHGKTRLVLNTPNMLNLAPRRGSALAT
jgi:hypothetical protein